MRIRFAAPLVLALLAQFGAAEAKAGLGGICGWGCTPKAAGDCQVNFATCDSQVKPTYKLVYDTVKEKRFKVCHETVKETVMKPVQKTRCREEEQTCYK